MTWNVLKGRKTPTQRYNNNNNNNNNKMAIYIQFLGGYVRGRENVPSKVPLILC